MSGTKLPGVEFLLGALILNCNSNMVFEEVIQDLWPVGILGSGSFVMNSGDGGL